MTAGDWTDEDIQRLRELAGEGWSASQIATKLGRVSRNSVIGKLHRLGIVRPKAATAGPKRVYERKSKPRNLIVEPPQGMQIYVYESVMPSPEAQPCTILELNDTNCHWPLDPDFCGAVAVDGKPYCAHHSRIAYRKPGEYR